MNGKENLRTDSFLNGMTGGLCELVGWIAGTEPMPNILKDIGSDVRMRRSFEYTANGAMIAATLVALALAPAFWPGVAIWFGTYIGTAMAATLINNARHNSIKRAARIARERRFTRS